MPPGFYSDKEPPRIGSPVQPPPPPTSRPDAAQGLNFPLAATPMTPSYPPRPPIDTLPKHPSMETGSGANKHPLEQPVQQGPPHKHVRPKAFPYGQSTSQTSMAAPSTADMFSQARHAQKVLQQNTCQHHLRLDRCLLKLQQLFQSPIENFNLA